VSYSDVLHRILRGGTREKHEEPPARNCIPGAAEYAVCVLPTRQWRLLVPQSDWATRQHHDNGTFKSVVTPKQLHYQKKAFSVHTMTLELDEDGW